MEDLEKISVNVLDKYNKLKLTNALYLDNNTQQLVFGGDPVVALTDKEFRTVVGHYSRYRRFLIEGGSCVGCTMTKLRNEKANFNKFLGELKIKYFGKGV